MIVGLKVRTPNAVMGVSMMVLFPLTFVSSVFAPPDTMPGWLQAFVEVNPVTLLCEAARGLMNDAPDAGDITIVLVLSVAITAVFAPIALRLYNREPVSETGSSGRVSRRGRGAGRRWRRPGPGPAGRAGRGTPRSGGTPARGRPPSRVCTLPQCGRPSWARMIGSSSAKYVAVVGVAVGVEGEVERVAPGRGRQRDVVGGGDPDLDREADPQPEASSAAPGLAQRGEAGLARDGVLHLAEDAPARGEMKTLWATSL